MLLAGGDQPDEALEGLKNITIVSSVPFVIVLSMLCVSIWKDLSRDPLVIREDLAKAVLDSSVTTAIRAHEGEPFVMQTTEAELAEVEPSPLEQDPSVAPEDTDEGPATS